MSFEIEARLRVGFRASTNDIARMLRIELAGEGDDSEPENASVVMKKLRSLLAGINIPTTVCIELEETPMEDRDPTLVVSVDRRRSPSLEDVAQLALIDHVLSLYELDALGPSLKVLSDFLVEHGLEMSGPMVVVTANER